MHYQVHVTNLEKTLELKKVMTLNFEKEDLTDSLKELVDEVRDLSKLSRARVSITDTNQNDKFFSCKILVSKGDEKLVFLVQANKVNFLKDTEEGKKIQAKIDSLLALGLNPGKSIKFAFETEKETRKTSRLESDNGEKTPDRFKVIKTRTTINYVIPSDTYEQLVNKEKFQEGRNTDFKSSGSQIVPYANSKALFYNPKTLEFYIRIYPGTPGFSQEAEYFDANNKPLSKEEMDLVRQKYLPEYKANPNSTQGLENQVEVRQYSLRGLKSVEDLGDKKAS